MNDNKLAQDEAQRAANYEAIKSDVSRNVGGEILAESRQSNAAEVDQVEDLAADMKQKAAREVRQTEREVGMGRAAARVSQIVDYVFFLIYGLLVIRLLLELFAARQSAGFFEFIKSATGILLCSVPRIGSQSVHRRGLHARSADRRRDLRLRVSPPGDQPAAGHIRTSKDRGLVHRNVVPIEIKTKKSSTLYDSAHTWHQHSANL